MSEDTRIPDVNARLILRWLGFVLLLGSITAALLMDRIPMAVLLLGVGWLCLMLATAPVAEPEDDSQQRSCPHCGESRPNADAVLIHVATEHYIVDEGVAGGYLDRVYQTRLVSKTPGIPDAGRNTFADPEGAKEYLEGYVAIRHDAEPGEWRKEQSADEKWSMYPDGFDGRAVVMGVPLRRDADALLEKTEEMMAELESKTGGPEVDDAE